MCHMRRRIQGFTFASCLCLVVVAAALKTDCFAHVAAWGTWNVFQCFQCFLCASLDPQGESRVPLRPV
jgi:hypothetical protein